MSYAARFRQVEVDDRPAMRSEPSRRAIKDQWLRLARQSAVGRSGACIAERCGCPNCTEYQDIVNSAVVFAHGCGLTAEEAFDYVCQRATDGAARTPWCNPNE